MKKRNSLFRILLLCIGVLPAQISFAQQTGAFDRKIDFGGNPNWALSYYIPTSYKAVNKYKLIIGLHGYGDTPQNQRDYMSQVGAYSGTNMYNAIIVCPYGGGGISADNTDFWTVCDTSIITRCITDAMSAYNIDPNDIYLSGFSIGGRAALRYGLLNYWRFRGLELWTPAIQTMEEANNLTSFKYEWQNGQYIPITISVGSTDGYSHILATAYQHLYDSGALVNFQIYYGMGHQPSGKVQDMINEWNYLDADATSYAMNDAGVSSIAVPFEEVCSHSFTPVVTVQNKGINNLTSVVINYQIDNGTINTYNWSGNLIRLGRSKVTLSSQSVSAGAHTFKAYTTMPNGVADTVPSNDSMAKKINSITIGTTMIAEGFEDATFPPAGWSQAGSDAAWGWKRTVGLNDPEFEYLTKKPSGANGSSSSIYFDNDTPDNKGKNYSIRTPEVDFTSSSNPILTYNYAYSPTKSGTDTLGVYYSIDCGSTWNTLLTKGGLALSTTGGYAPTGTYPFVPTSAQWKQETINLNLTGLIGQPEVMFSFENRADFGHMLYLDNINITTVTGVVNESMKPNSLTVYPNPNKGRFIISFNEPIYKGVVKIFNILGEEIYSLSLGEVMSEAKKEIELKTSAGIYFLEVSDGEKLYTQKLIVVND